MMMLVAGAARAQDPVKVCFENWQPYYFISEDGTEEGLVLELVRDLLAEGGFSAEFMLRPPKRCSAEVSSGTIDLVLTTERADGDILLGRTGLTFWVIAAVVPEAAEEERFLGLPHYRGKRALMIAGYAYPEVIQDFSDKWSTQETDYPIGHDQSVNVSPFRMIENNRADLFLEDMEWSERVIRNNDLKLKVLRPAVAISKGYIGYSPWRKDLKDMIEARLEEMAQSGELSRLYREKTGINFDNPDHPVLSN